MWCKLVNEGLIGLSANTETEMPSEKRKARKQNYFKAAKQSRKVQEVRISTLI